MDLSVVLVNHEGEDCLPRALRSLATNTACTSVEGIVVDSGSTDASWEGVETFWPAARCVRFEDNIGFAAGCNRGAEVARGRLIAFVNYDGEVERNWDVPLRALLDDPSVQAATGLLLSLDGGTIQAVGLDLAPNMAVYGRMAHERRESAPTKPLEVTAATGALMMVRRDEFLADGGFYEPGWMYGEEADYALRALQRGRIVLHPQSALRHEFGHTSGARGSPFRLYWSTRNKLVNAARHLPAGPLLRSLLMSAAFDLETLAMHPSAAAARSLARGWLAGLRRMPAERRARTRAQRRRAATHLVSFREAVQEYRRIERATRRYEGNAQPALDVKAKRP